MKEVVKELKGKEWSELLEHVYEHLKKDIKVDGFRKGQVPMDVYVKKYGIESLYNDAIDHAIPELYSKVLDENKDMKLACRPSVEIKAVDNNHLEVMFGLTPKPEVKLGKYKDLKIKKEKVTVTDEEIEEEIKHLKEQFIELKDKDGKVADGDQAIIDFEGFKDGVAFEGGKGENYPLVIGSNSFIPGFEEGLVGMKKGETKDLELTFPKNYHSEELKGKKVVFKVKVNEIKERIYPEYNEDFFNDLNMEGVKDEKSLKEEVKKHIEGHKEADIEDKYFEECLTKVSDDAKMDIPNEMIEEEIDRMINDFSERLKYQGMNIDTYINMLGLTKDQFKENFKPEATKRVKYRLVIEEVVTAENIKVDEKELNDYSKDMAKKYNVTEEEFIKEIGGKDFLKYDLEVRKALEIITK